jgi:hypothetical protein
MYGKIYDSENRSFCLYVTIKCKGERKFRVWAEEYEKKNSKYSDREITINGSRTIHINFVISPKQIFIGIVDCNNPKDSNFDVSLLENTLPTYNIWMDAQTKRFVNMALNFSQVCGYSDATNNGRIYTTPEKEFTIKYFNYIYDYQTGKPLNTPARIGHSTGNIEVSKLKFDRYTIPMRMMILLHEYSHVYKNPKIGLKISHEIGADINALYIYLGLGFSKIDAICVFGQVFLKAQTKGNIDRMRKIMDYINKFENQEFAERN